MSLSSQAKLARFVERHQLLFALFVLMVGLTAAAHALEYYYHRADHTWMFYLVRTVSLLQLLAVVLLLINVVLIMKQSAEARSCKGRVLLGSFAERTNFQALSGSWIFTFLMNSVITEWTEPDVLLYGAHDPSSLFPPRYYLQLLFSCMLLSYSLLFFFFYWRASADQAGDEQ